MITPFGRKVSEAERREKKEKKRKTLIVDTYFRDSARKPLGPI